MNSQRRRLSRHPADPIAIERAVGGDRLPITALERRLAIAELTGYGLSAAEVGRRLALSQRTVFRHRAALRTETTQ